MARHVCTEAEAKAKADRIAPRSMRGPAGDLRIGDRVISVGTVDQSYCALVVASTITVGDQIAIQYASGATQLLPVWEWVRVRVTR